MPVPKRQFQKELINSFNKDEIRELCFALGINHEELDEKTISTLTESLLTYTEKHGLINKLIELLNEERDHADWAELAFTAVDCPYRGLLPFREIDAHLFFGRDTYIERLLEAVDKQPLVAVIGPSGSGKSSVVFAGLVPRLQTTGQWQILDFRPGKAPFIALASVLMPLLEPNLTKTDQLREVNKLGIDLQQGNTSLPQVFKLFANGLEEKNQLLLVMDQFEELYTQTSNTDMQEKFLHALLSLGGMRNVTLLLTMRADFLGRALLYRPFADKLQDASQMIGPMDREELIEVIQRPLAGTFVSFEAGLTTQILDDVGEEPGNLPLLEFALTSLWDKQINGQLSFAAYEKIGKVQGALTEHADACYDTFKDATEAEQIRRIFVQLVQPVTGTVNTKRKAKRSELGNVLWPLTMQLADARLIVTGRDEDGEETIELTHEALITNWRRFEGWIQEDWEFRAWQERMRVDLRQWHQNDKNNDVLLRSGPLAEAEGWLINRGQYLSQPELVFIQASLKQKQRNDRLRRYASIGIVIVAIAMGVLALFAGSSAQNANNQAATATVALAGEIAQASTAQAAEATSDANAEIAFFAQGTSAANEATAIAEAGIAQAAEATSDANAEIALFAQETSMANEAVAIMARETAQAQAAISRAQAVAALAPRISGQTSNDTELAALLAIESVRLNDSSGAQAEALVNDSLREILSLSYFNTTFSGHTDWVVSVTFSPDNQWLASGSLDNSIRLWNLNHPQAEPIILTGHTGSVFALTFSPDGQWLASGSVDNTIRLWDMSRLDAEPMIILGHTEDVNSVVFSPDNRRLASGSDDNTIRLWDLRRPGAEPTILSGHTANVWSVAFSSDGQWLASGSDDKTVRLWDLSQPSIEPTILSGHKITVRSVAFSPDGQKLASAGGNFSSSEDDTIRLWDLSQLEAEPTVFSGHTDGVWSVAFSPDGQWLASGSRDDTVRLWEISQPESEPVVLSGHTIGVRAVNFSSDGQWLASASEDNTIRLWEMSPSEIEPIVLSGHSKTIRSMAYSPDGQWLASGSSDNTIRLWDVSQLESEPMVLIGHTGIVYSLAYSPDDRWLASGSSDNNIRLWDMSQIESEPTIYSGHSNWVTSVAFSPDGKRLASGSSDNTIRLWDVNQPESEPIIFSGHSGFVWSVDFSPNGQWLASGGFDKTIRLWDVSQPESEPTILSGHTDNIRAVSFSPNGQWLASGSQDNTIRLWNLNEPEIEPTILTGHTDWIWFVEFSPDGKWLASGSQDNTIRLWSLNRPEAEQIVLKE